MLCCVLGLVCFVVLFDCVVCLLAWLTWFWFVLFCFRYLVCVMLCFVWFVL